MQDIELTSSVYGGGGGVDNPGFDESSMYHEDEKRADRVVGGRRVLRGGTEGAGLPKPDETIRIYQFEEPSHRSITTLFIITLHGNSYGT